MARLHPKPPSSKHFIHNPFRKRAKKRNSEHEDDYDDFKTASSVNDMLRVISNMSYVINLTLESWNLQDVPHFKQCSSLVTAGWASFGHNLLSLTLDVNLVGYRHVLSPTLILPRLEVLTVELSPTYHTADSTVILCDVLAPFLNNQHHTLQSFDLSSRINFNMCAFLLKIDHLPRLRNLAFFCPLVGIRRSNTSGLRRLLKLHSETLQTLSLQFSHSSLMPSTGGGFG